MAGAEGVDQPKIDVNYRSMHATCCGSITGQGDRNRCVQRCARWHERRRATNLNLLLDELIANYQQAETNLFPDPR
jgi:hypothetical protein